MCSVASVMSSFLTPWTLVRQAPLSMGFSEQEYWSVFPCLPPGDLQDSEISCIFCNAGGFFFFLPLSLWGRPICIYVYTCIYFPDGATGKEPACQCRRHERHGLDPWVGKMPWRRKWQPIPVFLPGESLGQKSHRLRSIGLQKVRQD